MEKWENRENLPEARANHRGVNIGNVFLVIGGWGPEPPPPATTTQAPTIPGGGGSSAFGGWGGWTSGSSATFATAGGKNVEGLPQVLQTAEEILEKNRTK